MPLFVSFASTAAADGGGLDATPFIAVGGVIVGALIAGGVRLLGDRVERRAETQREAVYAVQEAALNLRTALRNYGAAGPRPATSLQDAVDLANGRLDLLVHRLSRTTLRLKVADWRELGELYAVGDPEVTNAMEETAWKTVHYQCGRYVRDLDKSRWLGGPLQR